MFKSLEKFALTEEKRDLILSTNLQNKVVKEVVETLNLPKDYFKDSPFKKVDTLGKFNAQSVIFLNENKMEDQEAYEKVFKVFDDFKDDAVLLVDTFKDKQQQLLAEMIGYQLYTFNDFKSDKPAQGTLYYVAKDSTAFVRGIKVSEAINFTRDLVNKPYNKLNAEQLAEIAKGLETYRNLTVNILEKSDCEKMKMGAFLGVNKGSTDAPKLIHITYKGNTDTEENTFLVGKGVMYDTGGYSLKGVQSMPTMKMDMGGAASTLGAIKAIASLGLKANVSVVIAATDNRIGDDAIVPDDILTSASGKTIEIISTDAEGRLTLADALWYAQKEGASKIIDLATLTGAVVAALGDQYVGAFTNNEDFYKSFETVVKEKKEYVWHLPIGQNHRTSIDSKVADMKNSGGRLGGASIAGAFLEKFVSKDIPWIHLDIAGTAYTKEKGATGVMVKSLTGLFE